MNGPSGNGTAGANAYSRRVQTGDIIIIPTGVGHGWSQITDHVTYLSVRPDPTACCRPVTSTRCC